jgi:3',5'-cyclic AMP phosphodiesterase CpdA
MKISMRVLFGSPGNSARGVSFRESLLLHHLNPDVGLRKAYTLLGSPTGSAEDIEITGAIHSHWRALGRERGPLGDPISENTKLPDGEIVFFKYGNLWTGQRPRVVLYADMAMPLLGKPMLLSFQRPAPICSAVTHGHKVTGLEPQAEPTAQDISTLKVAMEDKLFLHPVGEAIKSEMLIPLAITEESVEGLEFSVPSSQLNRVKDRQLYDIVLRLPNGADQPLSPHSVYATTSTWKDFSFVHVTDIHIAARVDQIQSRLAELVKEKQISAEAVKEYNNFNDKFADFIRFANRLHSEGQIDFILATGDLVDYLFEDGDRRKSNIALFKSLVLGHGKSSKGVQHEELKVPLFTTLGNHDYRLNPYLLLFSTAFTSDDLAKLAKTLLSALNPVAIGVESALDAVGLGLDSVLDALGLGHKGVKIIKQSNYSPYNMTEAEAVAFQGKHPVVDAATASKMVEIDDQMKAGTALYFKEISRKGSYLVELGERHSLVLINTKHDSGVTSNPAVALAAFLGLGTSKTKKFVEEFTNSEGVLPDGSELVERALETKPGLVIVGMHAPPICHSGKEFSHFFRETEHPRAPVADTIHFLLRNHSPKAIHEPLTESSVGLIIKKPLTEGSVSDSRGVGTLDLVSVPIRSIDPELIRGWRVEATRFFRKAKGLDDSSAVGVADHGDHFLFLCAGGRGGRKVDLILCGHDHSNVEYRVEFDPETKEFEYYLDYYTANPDRYYNSREFEAGEKEVAIRVLAELDEPQDLVKVRDHRPDSTEAIELLRRDVPINSNSLDRQQDPKSWWKIHSPLIVQTPALGPIDQNQRIQENGDQPISPAFQGIRVIDVRDDVIHRIRLITIDEIRKQSL